MDEELPPEDIDIGESYAYSAWHYITEANEVINNVFRSYGWGS